jgi:isopentenyl-diphosphate delta-isomerase
MDNKTQKRKLDHIKICLEEDIEFKTKTTGFEDISFIHRAIPEIDMNEINYEIDFLGHHFRSPLIIGAMTGGHQEALSINEKLAEIAEKFEIGIGVGSQRAAIEDKNVENTFSIVREKAPKAFVISNIGAPQLINLKYSDINKLITMLSSNALAIHLNKLQESIQPEGETRFKDFSKELKKLISKIEIPIIVKETGSGISMEDAEILEKIGVSAIDVSGSGGTSWAAVESFRGNNKYGDFFREWGIPTAVSIIECTNSTNIPIIASGGIRDGLDVAKALALGADIVSISLPFLRQVKKGIKYAENYLNEIIKQLQVVMYLIQAKNIKDLKKTPLLITGKTAEWLRLRGFDILRYSMR